MINPFANALRLIYNTIPEEILEVAFRPRDYQVSLDQRIKDVIINGRVLPDCNVNVGKIKRIPLYNCTREPILPDPGYNSLANPAPGTLYRIPPEAREHRDVVGVIDIAYPYDFTGYSDTPFGFGTLGNSVRSLAGAMLDSNTHRNACLTPTPVLLENNLVLINPINSFMDQWTLVCRLGYDEEFTNLSNSSIAPLCRLILTAVQAYIWKTLIIRIDQALLSNGQELGQFKTIVESYQAAADRYDQDLIEFRGSAIFDIEAVRYVVRAML